VPPYLLAVAERRLVGKNLDQRNLLVGERLDLRFDQNDDALWNCDRSLIC
jgi:hypothetical protein